MPGKIPLVPATETVAYLRSGIAVCISILYCRCYLHISPSLCTGVSRWSTGFSSRARGCRMASRRMTIAHLKSGTAVCVYILCCRCYIILCCRCYLILCCRCYLQTSPALYMSRESVFVAISRVQNGLMSDELIIYSGISKSSPRPQFHATSTHRTYTSNGTCCVGEGVKVVTSKTSI